MEHSWVHSPTVLYHFDPFWDIPLNFYENVPYGSRPRFKGEMVTNFASSKDHPRHCNIQGIATCSFQCSCLERTFCVFCFGCKSIAWFGLPTMQSGSLTLGSRFNQSFHQLSLPKNLESLTFGEEFQQPLDGGKLPATLQHLTFGSKFNQSLAMVPWTPWCDMAN